MLFAEPRAQGNPHLGRVFALHGASLAPAERACLARLPDDVLALLACGSVTVQEALFAVARDVPSPARASAGGGAAEEARARAAAQARALAAVAEADDADDGFEMTACIEPAEPAWLARARAALTSLLSESALAPRATREASLSALEGIIGSATRAGEAAAGRAVYLDKLRARVAKAQAPSAVKLEHAAASAPKSSRLSAAHSSPHGGAGAASGDDAAVTRCVDMICRVLSSAGWYLDSDGEESATGQPRARILLLAEARELPALLARLRDVASLLETLRADAKRADAAKRAEAALTAALEAIVIDSDEDEDASAAAWAERSAADAAKVLLAPVATPEPDPAAAPGFDAGFDDELWERYARSGAGRAESPPPPAESPQQHDVAKPAASPVARSAAITILSDDDDDVEIVAVVQAPRRAARAPPPPREECRITLFLPEGRGRARLLLPPTATLLDAYAAAKDYLATPARAVGVAFAPPVLPAHNWRTAAVVDTQSHKLVRPDPAPGRAFKPHELATTTLAQAGLFPSGRLVLERAGAVLRAPRIVAGRIDVLRLTTPLPNGNTLVSPIVHLHDPMGDLGVAMFKKMEPLLPGGWEQARHSWLVAGINGGRHPMPVVLNNSYWCVHVMDSRPACAY